jgi:hypothetical protein
MTERHRFHSICPYFAMFPESFVRRYLLAWSKRGDVVLDPFSGRGTTVFESLLNGRTGIGCDTNPVAACLSRAKANPPTLRQILVRLSELKDVGLPADSDTSVTEDDFFAHCFHRETLRQILRLRASLKWRSNRVDCFIAALALGCLHGESHRTRLCFSNRMPRTISTKPAYSVRWWLEHGYIAPERDVFSILRDVAEYRYQSALPLVKGRVVEGDARRAGSVFRSFRGRVGLVITSPPYLDITDYHEDQWLRLWFLGGPARPVSGQGKDDRHRVVSDYWRFLSEAWAGMEPLLRDRAQVIVRIGGTRLTADQLKAGLLHSLGLTGRKFRLVEHCQSDIRNGQTRVFSVSHQKPSVEHDFRFQLAG